MRTDWQTVDPRVVALLTQLGKTIAQMPGVARMVLYGSYAKGTSNEESDIDLAVFFTEKGDAVLLEEYRRLAHICATSDFDIQVQAFSEAELESPCGIIEEIDLYGVEMPLLRA